MDELASLPETEQEQALLMAAAEGRADIIGRIVSANPPLARSARDPEHGGSPLHTAVIHRSLDAVRALLRAGVAPDVRNVAGLTALDLARGVDDHALCGAFSAEMLQSVVLGDVEKVRAPVTRNAQISTARFDSASADPHPPSRI